LQRFNEPESKVREQIDQAVDMIERVVSSS